ncbi:MAG TPA: VWA domain-containing protein, partial [Rhizobiales bacterium]|nr:VWA domain-containing protein [Hyphomicrobiales bacterium]
PWNTRDERPSLKIPGIMNRSCVRQLTELTDNKQTVLREINAMTDNGATYIPAGLMWGWRVVSAGEPFDNNAQANGSKSHQRAIVLMTDGENTVSPTYPEHNGRNKTTADRLTSEICENIKASGEKITVYTVAFEVRDVGTQNLLRSCATSPSHFFNADNSAQLASSFQKIAKSLALLRIAE